jgi:ATP-dependent DNA helicase RecG
MRIEDAELKRLLAEGESFRVERKETLAGGAPNAVRAAICAFANDLPGANEPGVIFIGARDDGRATGSPVTDALLRQLADMKTDGAIVPPPSLFVEKRNLDGAEYAVVTVLVSDSTPVRYRGAIHVRVGPRKGLATAQDERILNEKRRSRDTPFDSRPAHGATLDDLNARAFDEDYLPKAFSPEVLAANERTREQRLAATKMVASVADPTPTHLGLFVVGRQPRFFVPSFYVQFLRVDGIELSDPILDAEAIEGTLARIDDLLDARMRSHIHTSVDFLKSDREVRTPSYPIGALRELARNAIMHRAFEGTNAPVRVNWFNDRIEIINPGGPFGLAAQGNFGEPGVTDYRNPSLAEAMRVLGLVQRFGVGIENARKLLRAAGHPDLEFRLDPNIVFAVVRRRKAESDKS